MLLKNNKIVVEHSELSLIIHHFSQEINGEFNGVSKGKYLFKCLSRNDYENAISFLLNQNIITNVAFIILENNNKNNILVFIVKDKVYLDRD